LLLIRRLAFAAWLYLSILIAGILLMPFLPFSRRFMNRLLPIWGATEVWGFKAIMGVRVELRGLEHRPTGAALVAGKHQSMLDTLYPFAFLDDVCFVMKRELIETPIIGWYAKKGGMIAVDREAHASALKQMVRDARDRMSDARAILIFPEGTRTAPGAEPDYKPGVAALYRDLGLPCHLLATNSGQCWPAHGLGYKPGHVVYEFLPPIPAGLKRAEFMAEMESRLETASKALLSLN
jgi:1-acyl-sn-glycerol-3-phosphate acyltransferase